MEMIKSHKGSFTLMALTLLSRFKQKFEFFFPPPFQRRNDLTTIHTERYIFLINIPVALLQFANQFTFWSFAVA